MTGYEPHPIFHLPTREQVVRFGGPSETTQRAWLDHVIGERRKRMEREKNDPLIYGFEPEIWHVVDDLLVDGSTVVFDLDRIARMSPDGIAPAIADVPKEIAGALEIWIGGSNRSSKSEYGVKKLMKVLTQDGDARTWSFADTGPISVARQQPIFWKYLPIAERKLTAGTGRMREGPGAKITYSKAGGFAGETFVLLNLSQNWFKNYAQDLENMEGDQLDAVLFDELRNVLLLKTIRGRMGDRGGIIIVSFTAIDENYSSVVDEYEKGSREVLGVDAELLPIKGEDGAETGRFEQVPRIKIAGAGSDGDQRANIVYFHITDNPFYGFSAKPPKPGSPPPVYGKERFYKLYRKAIRSKILARVYGILKSGNRQRFPEFKEAIHCIAPDRIPAAGTNYHVLDPCDGRNWAMIWARMDSRDRCFIYREWPSHGTGVGNKSAYVPGIGDPGPWTLPGRPRGFNAKPPEDGDRGPAQSPFGFGLSRYKLEILRCEGHAAATEELPPALQPAPDPRPFYKPNPLTWPDRGNKSVLHPGTKGTPELITERYMDSRYGSSPTTTQEGQTTLIEQMGELDMEFLAASGKNIVEGIDLIHELLAYDQDVPLGEWSPTLGRLNEPRLKISHNCPNLIYALQTWTGLDGNKGACKDFIDVLRYFCLADLGYIGPEALTWRGGGTY